MTEEEKLKRAKILLNARIPHFVEYEERCYLCGSKQNLQRSWMYFDLWCCDTIADDWAHISCGRKFSARLYEPIPRMELN